MTVDFTERHIGPTAADQRDMLKHLGLPSLETLIAKTVPPSIRFTRELAIDDGASEEEALAELREKLGQNKLAKPLIGQGYHGTIVPPVIQRNLFENPGWYTSYTPYQPEISQGRLELLFHFQTLIAEITGLPIANASLLDEGTAIAEAAGIALRHHRGRRPNIVLGNQLHPQSIDVLTTRADTLGLNIADEIDDQTAAMIVQLPDTYGNFDVPQATVDAAKAAGALVIVSLDPLAALLSQPPGEWGADIVVGSIQRYGVPLGNGGPHAAYMAIDEKYIRMLPGRLVGQSIDRHGQPAYRLALQTREQHIRREKATSNICTAQALLANMSAAFAIWHGPEGLQAIANSVHRYARRFQAGIKKSAFELSADLIFDTVTFAAPGQAAQLADAAEAAGILVRRLPDEQLSVAFDETCDDRDLDQLAEIFGLDIPTDAEIDPRLSARPAQFLSQEIFHAHRSETAMMRYLRVLMDKDLALDRAMIPLGSCTMKLNAAAEMMPMSWPEIGAVHPFAPASHKLGYQAMIDDLDAWLSEITGFAKVSFQPNAGSQGEYAGLLAISRYQRSIGQSQRDICLIPSSAHGTNPASAQMAGMDVVVVKCDANGNIDVADLKAKADQFSDRIAALMITYPSTHGVFEESVVEICDTVHNHGGQVYLDGANLNAMVGLARPGDIGADVCHMNLHKTFCIPHGGGGPGVGPIGVAPHLVPHLPGHITHGTDGAVSAASDGSASILAISWMYIRLLGGAGLTRASEIAILSANYLAKRFEGHFDVLYKGSNGFVAHECIVDTRPVKESAGVEVDDIAKRLIDFGFHAPTMSWPVMGTLMIEPTESEPKSELDRFADAMIAIREEIRQIEKGSWPQDDNPLHNAPHTAASLMVAEWPHPYDRAVGGVPGGMDPAQKYWPPVARVDNVHGDRNLVCTCPPMEDYMSEAS